MQIKTTTYQFSPLQWQSFKTTMNEWFNTGEEAEVTALLHYFWEYKVDTTFHKSTFTMIGLNRCIIFVPINIFLEIY